MNNQKKQKKKEDNKKQDNLIKRSIKFIVILAVLILMYIMILMTVFATTRAQFNLGFADYKFYAMESEAHPSIAKKGDLVIVRNNKHEEYKKGDGFVYGGQKFYYCDEVEEVRKENIVYKVLIAQDGVVKYRMYDTDVEGKVVYVIPVLGSIVWFLRTPLGIIFFILFTICLFILLRYLFVHNKKDEDDNENEEETDIATDEENYLEENNLKNNTKK